MFVGKNHNGPYRVCQRCASGPLGCKHLAVEGCHLFLLVKILAGALLQIIFDLIQRGM